jgi:uncharacterized protein involved in response to NO
MALTNWLVQLLIIAIVGTVFSLVAGAIVEAFTQDWLKTIAPNIEIRGFEFSITAFAVVTSMVKVWLFGF